MYWGLLYQKRRPRNDLRVMIKIFKDSYNIKHRFLTNTTGYNHLHYHVILVIISNSYCPYIMWQHDCLNSALHTQRVPDYYAPPPRWGH